MSNVPSVPEKTSKEKKREKYARKLAFTKFVEARQADHQPPVWKCCQQQFHTAVDIHKHVAKLHSRDINDGCSQILASNTNKTWEPLKAKIVFSKREQDVSQMSELEKDLPVGFPTDYHGDELPWLPNVNQLTEDPLTKDGTIVLFYKYRPVTNTEHVHAWQSELCRRLHLTGKIRIAREGINGTVGGSTEAAQMYIKCVMAHPLFGDMCMEDFKTSPGSYHDFPEGAKIGVVQEICPLGIPGKSSYTKCGRHLTPEEFHGAVERHLEEEDEQSVFIDCRNFYESKIGKFRGAIAPNLRKFSYWPEYIDKNLDALRDKSVYMYCTGGIRCERGSAYLKEKGVCKDVYQLKGGIHKYMEKFPDGHFRGKLFVFDDRYTIRSNDDVIAGCIYCQQPWDRYQPCSSRHCHQLVLSCDTCRSRGRTTCCVKCQENQGQELQREECTCTGNRERVDLIKDDCLETTT